MSLPLSPSWAADALLLAYAAVRMARPRRPSQPGTRGADCGATMILFGCFALIIAVLNTSTFPAVFLSRSVQWRGVALQSAGLALAAWSIAAMKQCAAASSRSAERLFAPGPYRHIRHPAYLGSLIFWSGAITASGNAIALASIVVAMFAAYAIRIAHEEQLLKRTVGSAYEAYCRRSWRLIPFLY